MTQVANLKFRLCLTNLVQLIREPTHFTENSSSHTDLIFTLNEPFVIFSGVGEALLGQNLHHCSDFAVFSFDKYKQRCFRRRTWKYDEADYVRLNQIIIDFDWSIIKSEDIEIYATNITDNFMEYCSLAIPNKMVTISSFAPPRLNTRVRSAIRKRKRSHKFAERLNNEDAWRKYRVLRNESTKLLGTAKHDFKSNLANKLNSENMSSKDWWKFF